MRWIAGVPTAIAFLVVIAVYAEHSSDRGTAVGVIRSIVGCHHRLLFPFAAIVLPCAASCWIAWSCRSEASVGPRARVGALVGACLAIAMATGAMWAAIPCLADPEGWYRWHRPDLSRETLLVETACVAVGAIALATAPASCGD